MHSSTRQPRISIRDISVFAVLGAIMFISFALMQGLPNVHLLGVFIGAVTLVYRVRALIPLYIYVLLYGIFSGFSFFWFPFLYIWLPLWLAFMLAGRLPASRKAQAPTPAETGTSDKMGTPIRMGVFMVLCGLHGLLFGVMYAPMQALFFGLSFKAMVAWVAAGFWFDVIHAVSNFFLAALIIPLAELLKKLK